MSERDFLQVVATQSLDISTKSRAYHCANSTTRLKPCRSAAQRNITIFTHRPSIEIIMPEFQTIPAEEGALLQKPKASLRRVIVCAAALSFVLGAAAATAVGRTTRAYVLEVPQEPWPTLHLRSQVSRQPTPSPPLPTPPQKNTPVGRALSPQALESKHSTLFVT